MGPPPRDGPIWLEGDGESIASRGPNMPERHCGVMTARNPGGRSRYAVIRAGATGVKGTPSQPSRETVPSLVPAQPLFEKVGRKR